MCPLRFILAGFSALLALLVAFHLLSGPQPGSKQQQTNESSKQDTQACSKVSGKPAGLNSLVLKKLAAEAVPCLQSWSSSGRTLLDFCTGKYLYDTVRWHLGSQQSGSSTGSRIIKR